MQIWHDLVSTDLVGTERERVPEVTAGGELEEMLAKLNSHDAGAPELLVLRMAAAVELYHRCGQIPDQAAASSSPPCPDETTAKPCAHKAAALLSTLIQEENEALLAEWLIAARGLGKTVPPILLPPLLELGVNKRNLRSALIAAPSERMRWLAKGNADWDYMLETAQQDARGDYKEVWETAEMGDRLAVLQSLRATAPEIARELLMSTWKEDPPEARANFLSRFNTGLSAEDEQFLEEVALDDRRKEVEKKAIQLLTLLPQSRLSQRMIARVSACVQVTARGIAVSLPPDCDKSMVRDGVAAKRQTQLGDKADWLVQMLGYVQPSHWTEIGKLSMNALLLAAEANKDWRQVLFAGWILAASTHKHQDWAMALIPHAGQDMYALIQSLDYEQRELLLMDAIRTGGQMADGQSLLAHVMHIMLRDEKWHESLSPEVSRALLSSLKATSAPADTQVYQNPVLSVLPAVALRLHPSLAEEALNGWSESYMKHDYSRKIMDQFMHTVQFRREMHLALRE